MKERYLSLKYDGRYTETEHHFIRGDKFLLDNYRRGTFVYNVFECFLTGNTFITPKTIIKQFNGKLKVWFIDSTTSAPKADGFCTEVNEKKDKIVRSFPGTNYDLFHDYDYKPLDQKFMVFDTKNQYQFLGVFQPQEWVSTEELFYMQTFLKVNNQIKFTPHHKPPKPLDEETMRELQKIFDSITDDTDN